MTKGLERAQRAYDSLSPDYDGCPECNRQAWAHEQAAQCEAVGMDYIMAYEEALEEYPLGEGEFCYKHRGRKEDYD